MGATDKQLAVRALNTIMELELAGVVKYTHYSLMVFGFNRIPIVSWMKGNAHKAGELVTLLGGHPSLKIGALLETEKHDIGDILRESLEHETAALAAYYDLLNIATFSDLMPGVQSVLLEEYAREMIVQAELHLDEVNKMLRKPGEINLYE